jgi:hypothetical protein
MSWLPFLGKLAASMKINNPSSAHARTWKDDIELNLKRRGWEAMRWIRLV